MYADQRILTYLYLCNDFGFLRRFLRVFRLRLIIRLRTFNVFRFFGSYLGQVLIFFIGEFRARCCIAMRLCRATMEVPYGADISNLANRAFGRFVVRARIRSHVRRAQRKYAYAQAREGRRQVLCIAGF